MSLFLDLLFPRLCAGCGRAGDYLCPQCARLLPVNSIVYQENSLISISLSLFKFNHPIRPLIHDLKYNYVTDIVNTLAKISVNTLTTHFPDLVNYWQKNHFVFVPVPIHIRRQNYRSFNQSALLSIAISQLLNLDYQNLLFKTRSTPAQVSLTKPARIHNPQNKFKLATSLIPPKIILFDDVSTTGATLLACASVFPDSCQINSLTLAGS